jgi:hypothetical protein
MHQAEIIVLLFAAVAGLVVLARKVALPYPNRAGLQWTRLEFPSAVAGSEIQPGDRVSFFFASAALFGGAVHVVARFPPKLAADSSARDRIGAGDDRHDCMDRAYDCPGTPRAAAFALLQLFRRQMPLRLLQSSAGLAFRIASKRFSRGESLVTMRLGCSRSNSRSPRS